MVIEFLNQKYQGGCRKGLFIFDKDNILSILNYIIEWADMTLPEYHPEPELKVGDVIELTPGQIVGIDSENSLSLILSETGPMSLPRIYDEQIKAEFDLISGDLLGGDPVVTWEVVNDCPEGDTIIKEKIDFGVYNVFKGKLITGRGFVKDWTIKVSYQNEDILISDPIEFWLTPKGVWYDTQTLDEDISKEVIMSSLKTIYQETERIIEKKEKEEKKEEDAL